MKAEHRRELNTNALADRMGRLVQGMKQPSQGGSVVLWVIGAVAIFCLGGWYVFSGATGWSIKVLQSRFPKRDDSSMDVAGCARPSSIFSLGLRRFDGFCLGVGWGRLLEGTVLTGAALTATMRRTPVAVIAAAIACVPAAAIPASELECGPRPDSTASAPATADSSAA